jgi:hypothetical protein
MTKDRVSKHSTIENIIQHVSSPIKVMKTAHPAMPLRVFGRFRPYLSQMHFDKYTKSKV